MFWCRPGPKEVEKAEDEEEEPNLCVSISVAFSTRATAQYTTDLL